MCVICTLLPVQVICVAHSSVSLDGKVQHSDQAKTYWVALVKDLDQKGYFIRTVDKEVSHVWSGDGSRDHAEYHVWPAFRRRS